MLISRRRLIGLALAYAGTSMLKDFAFSDTGPYANLVDILNHGKSENKKCFHDFIEESSFELLPVTSKGSNKEILIIGDNDSDYASRKISAFIDFLIENYGFDSIGIENFYGPPDDHMIGNRKKDFSEAIGNVTVKTRPVLLAPHSQSALQVSTTDLFELKNFPAYKKYLSQKVIPTYGIEDKSTLFDLYTIRIYIRALNSILGLSERDDNLYDVNLVPEYILSQLEDIMRRLRKGSPHLDIPEFCSFKFVASHDIEWQDKSFSDFNKAHSLFHRKRGDACTVKELRSDGELRDHRAQLIKRFDRLNDFHMQYWGNKRNVAIAETIQRHMVNIGSRRGIVLIGAGHINHKFNEPPLGKNSELQTLLPYTSMIVNASGQAINKI